MVPALSELCENLPRKLCDMVPTRGGQEPLPYACIRDAVDRYREAEKRLDATTSRTSAFARGLMTRLDEFNEVRVSVQIEAISESWKVSLETLHEFLSRYRGHVRRVIRETYAVVDACTCRQLIAARVIDLAQLNAMGGSLDRIIFNPEFIA